jgi:hypothetical protein
MGPPVSPRLKSPDSLSATAGLQPLEKGFMGRVRGGPMKYIANSREVIQSLSRCVCRLVATSLLLATLERPPITATEPRVQPSAFHEKYFNGEVPTAGGVILGVQTDVSTGPISGDELWLSAPTMVRAPLKLCVTVTSDDGRYQGSAEYQISAAATGTVGLTFPTNYRGRIAEYGPKRLAILATLRRDCTNPSADEPEAEFILLSLSGSGSQNRFVVRVNSGGATSIKLYATDNNSYTDCKKIADSSSAIAFDTECPGQVGDGGWHGFLVRKRYEIPLANIPLRIVEK